MQPSSTAPIMRCSVPLPESYVPARPEYAVHSTLDRDTRFSTTHLDWPCPVTGLVRDPEDRLILGYVRSQEVSVVLFVYVGRVEDG
jgi:hypothetical protein